MRSWLRHQLGQIGVRYVTLSHSAFDLIRKVKTDHFDVILCDHQLDDHKDGDLLLEEMRYSEILSLRTVFFIITGESRYREVIQAAEYAPDDYLLKPFTPEQLAARLKKALRKKRAFSRVYDEMEKKDYGIAIYELEKLIRRKLYLADALKLKAELLIALERHDEALTVYFEVSASLGTPWAKLGVILMLHWQRELKRAEAEAIKLTEEHPEFLAVYDFLSKLCEEKGEILRAIDFAEQACELTGGDLKRIRNLAALAKVAGDAVREEEYLNKIIEKAKRNHNLEPSEFIQMNELLTEQLRFVEAEKHIENNSKLIADPDLRDAARESARAKTTLSLVEAMDYNEIEVKDIKNKSATEILSYLDESFDKLAGGWSDKRAKDCRELLTLAFNKDPTNRKVVDAHIRYNTIAAKYGHEPHKPGT
jgi:DNA-binding response OmpR family regulator